MKLNINIIFQDLKESFSNVTLQKKSQYDNVMSFHAPLWIKEQPTFQSDRIYIINSEQLPEDLNVNGQCLLIMPEAPGKLSERKNISVIIVPEVALEDIFNQVISLFAKFTDWDYSLQSLIFQNASLDDLLKASFPLIGNSLSVHNNNFNYIAKYGNTPSQDDLSQMHKSTFFDPDYLLKVDAEVNDSLFYSRNIIHYKDKHTHQEYFFFNLFSGNTAAGRLVVIDNLKPFTSYDSVLIEHLGKYLELSLTYAAYQGTGKNFRRDSLIEFISGKSHSDDKILHLKAISPFSSLSEDQKLFCILCSYQNAELSEQYLSFQLEHFLPESICVPYEGRLVLLCANLPGQQLDAFFNTITQLMERFNLVGCCCNPFTDFYDFKFCYRQSIFTLHKIESIKNPPHLNFFKDYTLEHILRFGTSVLPARLICADCVMRLAEHDQTASVSYCDSLRTYLDTGRNMAETAKLLNVTRNTFLARLERIMRYVDIDIEDLDNRLYIQISLRLIKNQTYTNINQKL